MEHMLRKTLQNWGTSWEPIGNLKGTYCEHIRKLGKMTKKSLSPPCPTPPKTSKEKKARHLECMFGPSHCLHEISLFLFPKDLVTISGLGPCKEHPTCSVLGAHFILNK
jgi:hypothetical protein